MNTRRKFLITGSLAGTALLAAKPFQSIGQISESVLGQNPEQPRLFFLCTPEPVSAHSFPVPFTQSAKPLYLHAGELESDQLSKHYVASLDEQGVSSAIDEYKILYKEGVKIGFITAPKAHTGLQEKLNRLARMLKKEKNCQLVICLSGLGHKKESGLDDRTLAAESANIDMILGGHPTNYSRNTFVLFNKQKEEVILQHANGRHLNRNGFEVEFDAQLQKKSIRIQRHPHTVDANAMA